MIVDWFFFRVKMPEYNLNYVYNIRNRIFGDSMTNSESSKQSVPTLFDRINYNDNAFANQFISISHRSI